MQSYPVSVTVDLSDSPPQCLPKGYSALKTRTFMGGQLFGNNAAWLLLGFLAAQTYTFYAHSRDRPFFKALVYGAIIITIAESATEGFFVSSFLVSIWGNSGPLFVDQPPATTVLVDLHPLFDALPAILVQTFFVWRIWTFCMAIYGRKTRILIAAICFFIFLTSLCAFTSVIVLTGLFLSPAPIALITFARVFLVWTTSTAVADVAITACMMTVLYHARAHAYFGDTRDSISRLLRLTLQTGLLTSVLALPIGPLYFRDQPGGEYGIMIFLLGKSYLISLLANLNARWHHSNPSSVEDESTPNTSTIAFRTDRDQTNGTPTTASAGGHGVMSFMRTVTRTIHHDLTVSTEGTGPGNPVRQQRVSAWRQGEQVRSQAEGGGSE